MIENFCNEVGIGFLSLLLVMVKIIKLLNDIVGILFVKELFCKFRWCKLLKVVMEVGILFVKLLNFRLKWFMCG